MVGLSDSLNEQDEKWWYLAVLVGLLLTSAVWQSLGLCSYCQWHWNTQSAEASVEIWYCYLV